MKKLLLTIFQIVIINTAFSQDLLIKKNGEEIKVKVMEINQSEIKYKKALNLTGPIYTISKSDIFMIRYEDGTKDVFNEEKTKNNNDNNINNLDMASKGKEDANTFYKGNNSGAGGTIVATILTSPILGLIPAIACSSSEPSDKNLNYQDRELMRNADYNRAYTDQAHKIKKKKVWKAFGIASAIWLGFIIILNA